VFENKSNDEHHLLWEYRILLKKKKRKERKETKEANIMEYKQ
jgi:hypothetical protein